jgi:hypothetical protein
MEELYLCDSVVRSSLIETGTPREGEVDIWIGEATCCTKKILRPLLGYTKLDRQASVVVREWLNVHSVVEEIEIYQNNWRENVERMQDERFAQL